MSTGTPSLRSLPATLALSLALAACSPSAPAPAQGRLATRGSAAMLPVVASTGWETGLGTWTPATTSGTSAWHVVTHPETLLVPLDVWYATLTTDAGRHLPARSGTNVAWFGEDPLGSYIGTGYTAGLYSGGTSAVAQSGTLTSPSVSLAGATRATVEFDAWWEVEANPITREVMAVEVSSDAGATFAVAGLLGPTYTTAAPGQASFTSGGPGAPPAWRHYAIDLSAWAGQAVLVRFRFDTVDTGLNGFRGWAIDNVEIAAGTAFPAPTLASVSPAIAAPNAIVAIDGGNFVQGATLRLDAVNVPASYVLQLGSGRLLGVLPYGLAEKAYDVTVTNPDGQSVTLPGAFTATTNPSPITTTVTPSTGSAGFTTAVTLDGPAFVAGSTVTVGRLPATNVVLASATSLTATFPALPPGNHNVTVTAPNGQTYTKYAAFYVGRPNEGSTLAVTSPDGGEIWLAGSTHAITWTQTGVSTVAIELYRDGSYDRTLAMDLSAAAGSWSWTIPANLARSSGYQVRVANQTGISQDFSNATFTVPVTYDVATSVSGAGTLSCPTPIVAGQPAACTLGLAGVTLTSLVDNGVDVTASVSGGTYTIPALAANHTLVATFRSSVTTVALQSGGGQTAAVAAAFASPVCFRVLDLWGGALAGRTVAFTVPASGATGILGSASVVSGAGGDACVSVTAGTVTGAYLVTAASEAVTGTAGLTNGPGAPANLAHVSGSGQSATVGAAFGTALSARVTDLYGNVVPGVTVTFAAPASGARAVLSSTSATTAADGRASVTATAGTISGAYQATASTAGVATPVTFGLTNLPGAPAALAATAGSTPQSTTVGGSAFANALGVRVTDTYGNGVPGVTITWTAPSSGARATLSSTTAVTDAAGAAQVTATAGTVAGAYAVDASAVPGGFNTTFFLTNTAGAPAAIVRVSGDGQTTTVATAFAAPLVVQVTDLYSNPVAATTVTFTVPASGATAVLSSGSATTGADGRASVTATAGTVSGGYAATASVAGGHTATFTLVNAPGAASALAAVAGGGQAAAAGTAFPTALSARVSDAYGNAVPGVTVSFSVPSTGARASLSAASAVTGADGRASVNATAGTVAGAYQVTAGASGIVTPATFDLTNLPGPAATATAVAGSTPQAATVGGTAFGNALALLVVDTYGNPIPGVAVAFTAPATGARATLSATAATTGADGRASVTATTGNVAGAYAVTAAVAGVATPVSFSLTNNPGAAASVTAAAGSTPQSATAGGAAFANPLAVTVRDAYSNPLAGLTVTFTAPATGARATLSAGSAVTDAAGAAQVTATPGTVAGSYAVTAAIPGGLSTSFSLTNLTGPAAAIVLEGGGTQSATVGTAFAAALAVRVQDAQGNPVAGNTVTFAAPATGARATLSAATATTGADGRTSVTATASTTAGAYAVTATAAGVATPVSFSLTNLPGVATSMTAAAGSTPQSATVGTAFTNALAVTVRDTYGNPLPGLTVTFTAPASGARASLSAASAVTGAAGAAQVTATAGTIAGSYTVTAAIAGGPSTTFALANVAGAVAGLVLESGDAQAAPVGTAFAAPLAVRVQDSQGNPVAGVLVSFAVPASGATATTSAPSVSTGADGRASVTATAGTVAGAYAVTASAAGAAAPVTFQLENQPGAPASIAAVAGSTPQTTTAGGSAFANPLAVTVLDGHGNPVPGVTVSYTAPATGARAVLSAASAVTGLTGGASVTATSGAVAGGYTVTASVAGGLSATFTLSNAPGAPAALVLETGDAQAATVGAAFAAGLSVRLEDAFGNPVPGVLVGFQAPATGARAVLSSNGLNTDASGRAAVTATAGTVAGTYQVTASATGVSTTVVFHLENRPGAPAVVTAVPIGASQSAQVGTAFGQALAVTVRDGQGNAVPGVTVTWTPPASGATAALSAATAVTNAAGAASVTATAGTVAGAYTVSASAAGATPASFALTNTASGPATVAVVSGSPQEASVGQAFANALVVVVRDANLNPVPGFTVTFAGPASGAGAVLSAASAVTDAEGHASVTATAGTVAGAYGVDATVAGAAAPAAFALTNLAGAAATAVADATSFGQSAQVGTAFAAPLAVTVADAFGNPVQGRTVDFACPASGATCTLDAASAVTGADGRASVNATAGATPGIYDATATVGALPVVSFALENQVGPPSSIAIVSGATQHATVNQAFTAPLVVVVKDALQNPLPAVSVTYAVVASGPQGATLSSATATTAANGQASVTATANGSAGSYQVRATANGVAVAASFALTNDAAPKKKDSGGCSTGGLGGLGLLPLALLALRRRRVRPLP